MGCRLMRAGLLAFALFGAAIPARADQAGVFDLYVLAFSWNSNWCAIDGDELGAAQCETGAGMDSPCTGFCHNMRRGGPVIARHPRATQVMR